MKGRRVFSIALLLLIPILTTPVVSSTPADTRIVNTAVMKYYNTYSSQTESCSSNVVIIVTSVYELGLDFELPQKYVPPGDSFKIYLKLVNKGNDDLTDLSISDTFPNSFQFLNSVPGPDRLDSNYITWELDSLTIPQEDTITLEMDFRLSDTLVAGDSIWFNATGTASTIDSHTVDSSFIIVDTTHALTVDQKFHQSLEADRWRGAYKLQISNEGNITEKQLYLKDVLPLPFKMERVVGGEYFSPLGDSLSDKQIFYYADSFPKNSTDSLVIMGDVDTSGCDENLVNRIKLWNQEIDTVTSIDTSYFRCFTNIEFEKKVDKTTADPGEILNYSIIVRNSGDSAESNLTVVDSLPSWVSYEEGGISSEYSPLDSFVRWRLDTLKAGEADTFSFSAKIDPSLSPGYYEIVNNAYLWGKVEPDSMTLIFTESANTNVVVPFLNLTKRTFKNEVSVGDIVPFRLKVTNKSSNVLQNVKVIDKFPKGLSYLEGTSMRDGRKIDDPVDGASKGKYIWKIGKLSARDSCLLFYRAVVGWGATDSEVCWNNAFTRISIDGKAITSDVAKSKIKIRKGLFENKEFIIGKVWVDYNKNGFQDGEESGIEDAVLWTESGIKVETDQDGKYTIPDIKPGTHVIRLDEASLTEAYEPIIYSPKQALAPSSQFVYLPKYGIAKCNFPTKPKSEHIQKKAWTMPEISVKKNISPSTLALKRAERTKVDTLDRVHFRSGAMSLSKRAIKSLEYVCDIVNNLNGSDIKFLGYSDNIPVSSGAENYQDNTELSELRARSVREYVVNNCHVKLENTEVEGLGDENPIADNTSRKGRYKNRRVEVLLMPPEGAVAKGDSEVVTVNLNFEYSGIKLIDELKVDENFWGLNYIDGTANIDGNYLRDHFTDQDVYWVIDSLQGPCNFSISYKADVRGEFYSNYPFSKSDIDVHFVDGRDFDFKVSQNIAVNLPQPAEQGTAVVQSRETPSMYAKKLNPFFPNRKSDEFKVEKGENVVYQVTVMNPDTAHFKSVSVYDKLPKKVSYVKNSSVVNEDKKVEPEVKDGKIIWHFKDIESPFKYKITYQGYSISKFEQPIRSDKPWVKMEKD